MDPKNDLGTYRILKTKTAFPTTFVIVLHNFMYQKQ